MRFLATAWRDHRQKDEAEGQTFNQSRRKLRCCRISCQVGVDPTRKSIDSTDLNGTYSYDDEGIAGTAP